MAATGALTLERAGRTITEAGQPAWHAAGGDAPPEHARSPVYRDLSGCSFPYTGTNPVLAETGGWVTTTGNANNFHAFLPAHGAVTANTDWQVSFMVECTDTSGQGFLSFTFVNAAGNGVQILASNAHHLYPVNAGVRGAAVTNFDKASGAYVPCFVEWTYELATGEWRCYEDGVELGNWVMTTHTAADKSQLLILAGTFNAPANQTKYGALFIQDFIDVIGATIKRPLPFNG